VDPISVVGLWPSCGHSEDENEDTRANKEPWQMEEENYLKAYWNWSSWCRKLVLQGACGSVLWSDRGYPLHCAKCTLIFCVYESMLSSIPNNIKEFWISSLSLLGLSLVSQVSPSQWSNIALTWGGSTS